MKRGLLHAMAAGVQTCEFFEHPTAHLFKLWPVFTGDGASGRELEREEVAEFAVQFDAEI